MAKTRIKPRVLGGFRDYLPVQMIPRQRIIKTIRQVYEKFGFVPLETPAMEFAEILTKGEPSFDKQIYRCSVGSNKKTKTTLTREEGPELAALRFDLTVPLARVVASYPQEIPKPFKRYQIGRVWRGEKPQAGRYREFVQFDIDIVGSASMLADTEIINVMYEVLKALGLDNFLIRFNNRKILNGLPEYAGFPRPKAKEVFRVLDKVEKIGLEEVKKELQRGPADKYDESALSLGVSSVEKIVQFLEVSGSSENILPELKEMFRDVKVSEEGIRELEEISENLKALKIPQKCWKIDLSIARGLEYYTGPVFEATIKDLPQLGSIFGGGRFDELVGQFSGGKIPATGVSIGIDRLFTALEKLKKISPQKTLTQALVTIFDPAYKEDYLGFVKKLRDEGINTELYLGDEMAFKTQFNYAVSQEIPIVLIMGEDEKKENKVKVRNMVLRQEQIVLVTEMVDVVKGELSKISSQSHNKPL